MTRIIIRCRRCDTVDTLTESEWADTDNTGCPQCGMADSLEWKRIYLTAGVDPAEDASIEVVDAGFGDSTQEANSEP